ncbi:hypothetical protein, partial [Pseudomonas sp. 2822-17]|uniref:hypothetical protein n=1 Tax=Pseudomonas sp. 2822-17 TaxID=1712678 RepID=UPI001C47F7CA
SNIKETNSDLTLQYLSDNIASIYFEFLIPNSIFSGEEDVTITKEIVQSGVSQLDNTMVTIHFTIKEGNEVVYSYAEPVLLAVYFTYEDDIDNLEFLFYQDEIWHDKDPYGRSYT